MTRKENLIALRDAVVAGDTGADIFRDIWCHEKAFTMETAIGIKRAFLNGDMNAALAFVAEVLPGWEWQIDRDGARVWIDNPDKGPFASECHPVSRALLIAALNALIEETDE